MSQSSNQENFCNLCKVPGHSFCNCIRAVDVTKTLYNLFALNEYIYINEPDFMNRYRYQFPTPLEAITFCLNHDKTVFKKDNILFLYHFLDCYEDNTRTGRPYTWTKEDLVRKVLNKFSETKDERRSIDVIRYNGGTKYVFDIDRNRHNVLTAFNNIQGNTIRESLLTPHLKKSIEIINNVTKYKYNSRRNLVANSQIRSSTERMMENNTRPVQNVSTNVLLKMTPIIDDKLLETQQECSICISEIEKEQMCFIDCNHFFHFNCILQMCSSKSSCSNKCPMCRTPVTKTSVSQQSYMDFLVKKNIVVNINC